jgi:hypothetical protein
MTIFSHFRPKKIQMCDQILAYVLSVQIPFMQAGRRGAKLAAEEKEPK